MTPLAIEAPAKLNLSLHIAGRRHDGYHELDSVMVLLELADRLVLTRGCSGLRVTDAAGEPVPDVPLRPEDNLAWRGLAAGLGGDPHAALACLTLEKRIPAAAGLGGGSSDAAAGWRLGRAWTAAGDATRSEVAELAAIGADVPFFAAGVAAGRVRGIGERIDPLPVAADERRLVLVHPPFGLATVDVFTASRAEDWQAVPVATVADALEHGANDLLAAARRLRPELDDLLALVTATGVTPRLTGSGPTLFAVVEDPDHGARVVARLARDGVRAMTCAMRRAAASIDA